MRLGSGVLLDSANECLVIQGNSVPLRPKVYGVLRYLVDHPDRIVTKDELLDAIWADTVVGDSVLKVCVRELRSALDDDTKQPRFIATVHRRGSRYVGETELELAPAPPAPPSGPRPLVKAQTSATSPVGRDPELAHLEQALANATAGMRRTVFVSGPAGIGKTYLIEEALSRFTSDPSVRVLRGRCQEASGLKEAYLPFIECVGELARDGGGVDQLRRVAPTWFVQFPWLLEDKDRTSLERELHGATQSRMLREVDMLLNEASDTQTMVLVLEDLQWSDASTVDLLSFLATRDTPARLLIIASTRSVELIVDGHPLREVKRELTLLDRCSELPMELLRPDDVRELITQRLAGAAVAPGIAPWIHSRTEGHPLFVMHLLEHLLASQHLESTDAGWTLTASRSSLADVMPSSLPGIVDKNLERFVGDERRMLEAAALAGFEFGTHAVTHATDFSVEDVEDAFDVIASQGDLIVPLGVVDLPSGVLDAQYRFTHALLRDSLRRSMPPARRVRWQRRLAERGEALYGDRAGEIASHLAIHFEEARLYERAIHYHRIAARNAQQRFANGVAVEHLLAAQELLGKVEFESPALQSEIEHELARALRASGDVGQAADAFEAIADASSSAVDSVEALLLAAGARSWLGRSECMGNVDRALSLAESIDDPATKAHAEGCAAYWRLLWDGWEPSGLSACTDALRFAEERGRADHALAHRARLAFFLTLEGQHDEAARTAELAHEEAVRLRDGSESLLAHFYRALALLMGGRLEEAKKHTTGARDEAVLNGHVPWGVLFNVQLAWIAVESGDPSACAMAEAASCDAAGLGPDFVKGFADVVLGLATVDGGDEAKARLHLEPSSSARHLMDWLCQLIAQTGRARLGDKVAQRELAKSAKAMGTRSFLDWGKRK